MEVPNLILILSILLIDASAQDDENSTNLERRAANRKIRIKLSGSMPIIEIERSENDRKRPADGIKEKHNLKSKLGVLRTGSTDAVTAAITEAIINEDTTTPGFLFDQILNDAKLTPQPYSSFRKNLALRKKGSKNYKKLRSRSSTDTDDSQYTMSSSEELYKWKDQWAKIWEGKKLEALNVSTPRGDFVNMVAARPWGVPCGDPKQNPVPWGTCMLPQECESEFRIYRGDIACGRTQFVCCGMQHTAYDFYNAFDASFESSDMKSDTPESSDTDSLNSRERRKRKKKRDKKRRARDRKRRKQRIRRSIKKIVTQMKKILNRMRKQGDKNRKWKTKQLKNYVKYLKKQYKSDLENIKDIHENEMIRLDKNLIDRLKVIAKINIEFQKKKEFKDIIVHGIMSKKVARELFEAYPELLDVVENSRRTALSEVMPRYLDYDIEYGFLYY